MTIATPAQCLAAGILASAKRREDSYDHSAADAATGDAEKGIAAGGLGLVNYDRFYGLTMEQSCQPEGDLAQIIYLLLQCAWNDALDWATEVTST
jgi:hypothetical protein